MRRFLAPGQLTRRWCKPIRSYTTTVHGRAALQRPPESILLVNKQRTKPIVEAIGSLHDYIRHKYPKVKLYHEDPHHSPDMPPEVQQWGQGEDGKEVDLVLTVGGDGTILYASSLFRKGVAPPVLSFSMGTIGFLLPFHIDDYAAAIDGVFDGRATVLSRMRLSCTFHDRSGAQLGNSGEVWQIMNEVALHRGQSPHLTTIEAYVDNQHLTESVSDGLIISTPTGSTAYSLSAGGPIVHPSLSAIVVTPICPRSLSFRPLVFPSSSSITLRIGDRSRAPASVSMDGIQSRVLEPGQSITVHASPYPVPCINRSSLSIPESKALEGSDHDAEDVHQGIGDDWVRDLNNLLQYNATFRGKAMLKNQQNPR